MVSHISRRRVVVTGMGTVNPVGNTARETWEGLCAGKSGIAAVTRFDTSKCKTKIGGELKGFDPLRFVSAKEQRRTDEFIIYALAAAEMALEDAGLKIGKDNAERTGTIIGSGIGGLATVEKAKILLMERGPQALSPFMIPAVLANLAAGQIAIRSGAKGPINCTVTACASGAGAIGDAFRLIREGYADAMIAGGSEAVVTPLAFAGFNAMRALSVRNDRPEAASRPFDRDRDGFVIGEGSGIVILEELSSALDRGAHVYAEISGIGMSSDAYHVAIPPPGHEGAARCMRLALEDAGWEPSQIDYINAHGTSTPPNDIYETQAIKAVFGKDTRVAVSSTKSMTGHLLGAAGGLETIITAMAVEKGTMPPTINLDNPDPECDLDYIPNTAREIEVTAALTNSLGFGGHNASLVVKKFS